MRTVSPPVADPLDPSGNTSGSWWAVVAAALVACGINLVVLNGYGAGWILVLLAGGPLIYLAGTYTRRRRPRHLDRDDISQSNSMMDSVKS